MKSARSYRNLSFLAGGPRGAHAAGSGVAVKRNGGKGLVKHGQMCMCCMKMRPVAGAPEVSL